MVVVIFGVGFLFQPCNLRPVFCCFGAGSWTLGVELLMCAHFVDVASPSCLVDVAGWDGAYGDLQHLI